MNLRMQIAVLGERWEDRTVLQGIPLKIFYEGKYGEMVSHGKCWMRNTLRHRGHIVGEGLKIYGEGIITVMMPKIFHFHFHRGRKCRFERRADLDETVNEVLIKQD